MEETTSVAGADNTDAQAAAAKRFAEAFTELMSSMEDCQALGVDIVAELELQGVELPPFATALLGS
jgi:hypothetical protein